MPEHVSLTNFEKIYPFENLKTLKLTYKIVYKLSLS